MELAGRSVCSFMEFKINRPCLKSVLAPLRPGTGKESRSFLFRAAARESLRAGPAGRPCVMLFVFNLTRLQLCLPGLFRPWACWEKWC